MHLPRISSLIKNGNGGDHSRGQFGKLSQQGTNELCISNVVTPGWMDLWVMRTVTHHWQLWRGTESRTELAHSEGVKKPYRYADWLSACNWGKRQALQPGRDLISNVDVWQSSLFGRALEQKVNLNSRFRTVERPAKNSLDEIVAFNWIRSWLFRLPWIVSWTSVREPLTTQLQWIIPMVLAERL